MLSFPSQIWCAALVLAVARLSTAQLAGQPYRGQSRSSLWSSAVFVIVLLVLYSSVLSYWLKLLYIAVEARRSLYDF